MISTSAVKASHNSLPSTRTMKEILSQFAAYNTWANQKLFDVIVALPEEKQLQELQAALKIYILLCSTCGMLKVFGGNA